MHGGQGTGKGREDDGHYQDRAYRRAWASFDPCAEEEERNGLGRGGEESLEGRSVEEEGGEEGQRSRATAVPKAPKARAWEDHMVSYWPFCNWFEHCARGQG